MLQLLTKIIRTFFEKPSAVYGLFGTQEFHGNHARILQESVQFHRKNAGTGKNSRVPNRP
jgi:hypothetical protein